MQSAFLFFSLYLCVLTNASPSGYGNKVACNTSVILDQVQSVMKAAKSMDNTVEDMMRSVEEAESWLKTHCNVECDKNQEILKGEPYCSLDLAFNKIKQEYKHSLPKTENLLEPHVRWMFLLKLQKELLDTNDREETFEKVSYILTDFQPYLLSLFDFWSAIDFHRSYQEYWLDLYSSMLSRLTQTEEKATKLCASLSGNYSPDCNQRVKRNCDQFRTFLTHMNEIHEMKMGHKPSESEWRLMKEKQKFIETEMNKMKNELEENLKRNIHQKIWRLHQTMTRRVLSEKYLRSACTFFEYMNGGEMPHMCQDVNANSFSPFTRIDFEEELCAYREVKKRSVVVPAVFPKDGEEVEEGVINLKELFGLKDVDESRGDKGSSGGRDSRGIDWDLLTNASLVEGKTTFKIPNMEWLLKHGWISEEEKNQGPFFLREFNIVPLAELGHKPQHHASIFIFAWSSPLKGKQYSREGEDPLGGFGFSIRSGMEGPWFNPYNNPRCNNQLENFTRYGPSWYNFRVVPTIFSPWIVRQDIYQNYSYCPIPFPVGKLYLQARIEVCMGPVKGARKIPEPDDVYDYEYYPKLLHGFSGKCCNSTAYFDGWDIDKQESQESNCATCPHNSKSRLNGYYCELCPAGAEPADGLMGCIPCKPGYFKATSGMEKCQKCNGNEKRGFGQKEC